MKGKEKKLAEKISKWLTKNIKKDKNLKGLGVFVDVNKKILTDVTCTPEKNSIRIIHGFSDVDIVIYLKSDLKLDNKENSLIKYFWIGSDKKFLIPLVVIELKVGDSPSDSIRARDFIASRIKSVFPFVAYFFIASNENKKKEMTLLRQGKSFTNYFIIKGHNINEEDVDEIYKEYISVHIKHLHESPALKNLSFWNKM